MAVGAKDPVLGAPVMNQLRGWIRGCPEPEVIEDGGISCRNGAKR